MNKTSKNQGGIGVLNLELLALQSNAYSLIM